jgi:hypothetical protein
VLRNSHCSAAALTLQARCLGGVTGYSEPRDQILRLFQCRLHNVPIFLLHCLPVFPHDRTAFPALPYLDKFCEHQQVAMHCCQVARGVPSCITH